jgi:hypothetical protein
MRKIILVAILLGLLPFIQGCATATYGKAFEQTQTQGQYTAKIFTNAFTSQKEATERVNEESKKFMAEKGYKSYKIISTKVETFPISAVTFVIQFTK